MKAGNTARPCLLIALIAVLAAAVGAFQAGSEVLGKLGLTPASAHESILDSLVSGQVYNDAAFRAFKALAPSARAAVVRGGLNWIKTHVSTAEFKAAYDRYREEQKPQPAEPVAPADEQLKQQKAELKNSIAEMRKNMAGLDAETRRTFEETIQQMQAQFDALEQNPEMLATLQQGLEMQREDDKRQYEEQLRFWEEEYPADLCFLIKKRIREFMETSADVDYAAKLVKSGSKMRFADEAYEEKPEEWKICFRAGKEATEAAREFASAWLAEMEK